MNWNKPIYLIFLFLFCITSCHKGIIDPPGPDPVEEKNLTGCDLPDSLKGDSLNVDASYASLIKASFKKSKLATAVQTSGSIYYDAISAYQCNLNEISNQSDSINQSFQEIRNVLTELINKSATILLDTTLNSSQVMSAIGDTVISLKGRDYGSKKIDKIISNNLYYSYVPKREGEKYRKIVRAGLKLAVVKAGVDYEEFLVQKVPGNLIAKISLIPTDLRPYVLYQDKLDALIDKFLDGYYFIIDQIVREN